MLIFNTFLFALVTIAHPDSLQYATAAMLIGILTGVGSIILTFVPLASLRTFAQYGKYVYSILFGIAVYASWLAPDFGRAFFCLANAAMALGIVCICWRIVWLMDRRSAS